MKKFAILRVEHFPLEFQGKKGASYAVRRRDKLALHSTNRPFKGRHAEVGKVRNQRVSGHFFVLGGFSKYEDAPQAVAQLDGHKVAATHPFLDPE